MLEKLQLSLAFLHGKVSHVNDPMRVGGDPGKWTDCVWAILIILWGRVVNLNGRVKPWGGKGWFKGVVVTAFLDPEFYTQKGMIRVSAGADSGYDAEVAVEDLMSGKYDTSDIILATLSTIDLSPLLDRSLYIDICAGVPAGASVGSSAAVQVAILHALCGEEADPYILAMTAVHAEIDIAKRAAGNQDPLAAAYGAIKGEACLSLKIANDFPEATVTSLPVGPNLRAAFKDRVVLTFLGCHDSSNEHGKASERMQGDLELAREVLSSMRDCADKAELAVKADSAADLAEVWNSTLEAHGRIHPELIGHGAKVVLKEAEERSALGSMLPGAGGSGGSVLTMFSTAEAADAFARRVAQLGFRAYHTELSG